MFSTVYFLTILIFLNYFIDIFIQNPIPKDTDPGNLLLVVELFRHGARGPLQEFYDYKEQQELGLWGELTPVGMHQHYQLGQQMRKEFIQERQYLSETYNLKEMEIFSSDVNRTIQSAYSHYHGFYPIETGVKLKPNMKNEHIVPPYINIEVESDINNYALQNGFTTLPVHQWTQKDFILSEYCPNKHKLQEEYENENPDTAQYVWNTYGKQLAEKLQKILKNDVKSLEDIRLVQDNFFSDIYQNRPLPEELTKEMKKQMLFIYNFQWLYKNQGKKNQVMSAELLKFVKNKLGEKISLQNENSMDQNDFMYEIYLKNEMQNRKWIGISGHDSNIIQVMVGLNLSSPQCLIDKFENKNMSQYNNCLDAPLYASQFLFELYQNDEQFIVKLRYNGKYLNICGDNKKECVYSKFSHQISDYVVKDPWKECGMNRLDQWATPQDFSKYSIKKRYEGKSREEYLKSEDHFVLIFIIIGLSVTIIILFVLLIKLYMQEKKDKNALIHRDGNKKWVEMA